MRFVKDCPLCHITRDKDVASIGSRVLYSTDNLYIAVDISPLCLGHILLITKSHYFNFYELPKEIKEETKIIMKKIRTLFKKIYHSDTLFFEHGSLKSGKAGASVDHAHLHAIPLSFNFESVVEEVGHPIPCDILSSDFSKDFSYLYMENLEFKYIYKVDELPSQYLRKLLGEKIANQEYNWRAYYLTQGSLDRVEQTYSDLKGKIK